MVKDSFNSIEGNNDIVQALSNFMSQIRRQLECANIPISFNCGYLEEYECFDVEAHFSNQSFKDVEEHQVFTGSETQMQPDNLSVDLSNLGEVVVEISTHLVSEAKDEKGYSYHETKTRHYNGIQRDKAGLEQIISVVREYCLKTLDEKDFEAYHKAGEELRRRDAGGGPQDGISGS